MTLFIDTDSSRTLIGQLYEQLREAIVAGRLAPGERLLPTRSIAAELGVSRSTVTTVYGRLRAEGYIEGRAGGGSVVSVHPMSTGANAPAVALSPRATLAGVRPFDVDPTLIARYDLRPGRTEPTLFPSAAWRSCVRTAAGGAHQQYGDPAGAGELRTLLARWITRTRGVIGAPEEVVITSGAGHAVDLVARVLVEAGDTVCVEEPGYPPVANVLRAQGVEVVGAPVDDEGLVVDAIPDHARIVYVTPSHQYPLGVVMSRTRRRQLLHWASRHDAAIIEDDYDTEFRRTSRPLEPLQLLDRDGRVIYVGTFAKTVSPALRVGFLVAPAALVPAITTVRQAVDWCPPALVQDAFTRFVGDGHLDRHLRRARTMYRNRHRLISDALRDVLPTGYRCLPSEAGLHITVTGPDTPDEPTLVAACRRQSIFVGSLRRTYRFTDPLPGFVVGFGGIADEDVLPGVRALSRLLRAP